MKQIILTFALVLTGLALFGQSPRIRLNQITKDSITGSIVLSGSDSNMVYSRDFFINFQDSVLLLFGDTLSTTATAFSGVTTDLTLTGNGTVGNELKVDTAIIATVSALADSLAGIISSVSTDITLTGDGTVATPLKVDTAVIATIKALSDSLATLSFATNQDISDSLQTLSFASLQDITDTLDLNSRGFLTQNQTITLTDDATGSGTTSISVTVVNDSHNHTISTLTGIQDSLDAKAALVHTHVISDVAFLQDSLDAKANDADLNNYLLTSNYIVDSTRINLTGDTAYYYQNGVLIGTGAIAGGGGGGSGTVTSITAGTFLSGGTITSTGTIALDTASAGLKTYISENGGGGTVNLATGVTGTLPVANGGTGATTLTSGAFLKGNGTSAVSGSSNLTETADTVFVSKFLNVDTSTLYVDAVNNRVGIGTSSPSGNLHINAPIQSSADRQFLITDDTLKGFFAISEGSSGSTTYIPTFIGVSDGIADFGIGFTGGPQSSLDIGNNDRAAIIFDGAKYDAATNTFSGLVNTNLLSVRNYGVVAMTIKANLNVGIGTTTPATKLHVDGTIRYTNRPAAGTITAIGFDTNGDLKASSSSQRYKYNIRPYNKGLDIVNQLNPVYFSYNGESRDNVGFIAEDFDNLGLSELTLYQNETIPEGIIYSNITALLTKAIQEQQAIINQQQSQINDLLQRIINLENK